jgi:WD40 repeat protein
MVRLATLVAIVVLAVSAAQVRAAGPTGAITALAVSPDGSRLAVGTYRRVVVYDTATWQPVASSKHLEDYARSLAFTPDGKRLLIGSGLAARSGDLVEWDPTGAATDEVFPPQTDTIEAIAMRPDGKALLVASNDNKAHFYANLPYKFGATLDEHNGRVLACAFSPGALHVFVTGAMDKIVKVWDADQRHTVINFDQAEAGITGLVFLPDGVNFVGSSLDGRLFWWHIDYNERKKIYSGYNYRTVGGHDGGVFALGISNDRQRIISGGGDHRVVVYRSGDGGQLRVFKDVAKPIYAVALSPDGKTAFAGGEEGTVSVWSVDDGKAVTTLSPSGDPSGNKENRTPAAVAASSGEHKQ